MIELGLSEHLYLKKKQKYDMDPFKRKKKCFPGVVS